MTGLESVQDNPLVKDFLQAKEFHVEELLPGWKGWDKPHLMHRRTGAILPTSPEMLMDDARKWKAMGATSWPCAWPNCDCDKRYREGDPEFCKGLLENGGKA